jgi:predicted DNA-binding antitoxin AbrB/MazE fold protein
MELNVSKPKKIVFRISIANVDVTNVEGTFILFLTDSLFIGVSTIVENGKLAVTIPPLKKFGFKEGKEHKVELRVVANRDYYTIPWTDKVIIKKSINVNASVKSISEEGEPYILVTKPIVIKI